MATILRSRHTLFVPATSTTCLLTYYWDSTGATLPALATEALARVRAQWFAMAALLRPGATLVHFTALDEIEETNGQIVGQAVGTAPAAVTFTSGSDSLPAQTQGLLNLTTGAFINGRRLKGRQYIPGLTLAANTATGGIGASTVTAINAGGTALGTTVVTPMNQRVWHRPQGGAGGLSAVVVSRAAGGAFAVLRSRRV